MKCSSEDRPTNCPPRSPCSLTVPTNSPVTDRSQKVLSLLKTFGTHSDQPYPGKHTHTHKTYGNQSGTTCGNKSNKCSKPDSKFHFHCPGIFNITFQPHLETSKFFLCLSHRSQWFSSPHVLSITFIVWWGIPCRLPFSQPRSFLWKHPEQLLAKSHRSQMGKAVWLVC